MKWLKWLIDKRLIPKHDVSQWYVSSVNKFVVIIRCYDNNNSLHIYSTFLGTQSALHRGGGGGDLLIQHQCAASTWMMM